MLLNGAIQTPGRDPVRIHDLLPAAGRLEGLINTEDALPEAGEMLL